MGDDTVVTGDRVTADIVGEVASARGDSWVHTLCSI